MTYCRLVDHIKLRLKEKSSLKVKGAVFFGELQATGLLLGMSELCKSLNSAT